MVQLLEKPFGVRLELNTQSRAATGIWTIQLQTGYFGPDLGPKGGRHQLIVT